jgi:ribosome-binding factor A
MAPPPLCLHVHNTGLGEVHGAEKVDVHRTPPTIHAGRFYRLEAAGIVSAVEQHIDASEFRHRAIGQRLALRLVGDIRYHLQYSCTQAQCINLLLRNVQLGRSARRQHHRLRTFFGCQRRQLLSEARDRYRTQSPLYLSATSHISPLGSG